MAVAAAGEAAAALLRQLASSPRQALQPLQQQEQLEALQPLALPLLPGEAPWLPWRLLKQAAPVRALQGLFLHPLR